MKKEVMFALWFALLILDGCNGSSLNKKHQTNLGLETQRSHQTQRLSIDLDLANLELNDLIAGRFKLKKVIGGSKKRNHQGLRESSSFNKDDTFLQQGQKQKHKHKNVPVEEAFQSTLTHLESGAFGSVFRGVDTANGEMEVAIKLFRMPDAHRHDLQLTGETEVSGTDKQKQKSLRGLKEEVKMFKKIRSHANIVEAKGVLYEVNANGECVRTISWDNKMAGLNHKILYATLEEYNYDTCDGNDIRGMVLEYCTGGDLYSLADSEMVKENKPGSVFDRDMFESKRNYAKGILKGVQHIHDQDISHRDLKPENVLLCGTIDQRVAKITDFGLAHLKTLWKANDIQGTPGYIPPEKYFYGDSFDLYSTGVMFAILFDYEFGFQFVDYGVKYVRQTPTRSIEDCQIIEGSLFDEVSTDYQPWRKAILSLTKCDREERVAANDPLLLEYIDAPACFVTEGLINEACSELFDAGQCEKNLRPSVFGKCTEEEVAIKEEEAAIKEKKKAYKRFNHLRRTLRSKGVISHGDLAAAQKKEE